MSDSVRRTRRSIRNWTSTVWVVLITLIFLWQALAYRGLVGLVAEWQFNEFGDYRPVLTYLVFTLLLGPLPLLLFRRRRRPAREGPQQSVLSDYAAAQGSALRFLKSLYVLAILAFGAAVICLVAMWWLPSDTGPIQRINASDTLSANPKEGATELGGKIIYNSTSAFDENLWFVRHSTRFAPLIGDGTDETAIRYFVELSPSSRSATTNAGVRRGILKRNALPGELLRLYRYAGFRVFPDHYVLFNSTDTMRWPYLMTAIELAGCGLLILIAAAIQGLRYRRLTNRQESDDT